jgi:hypothetical protein
MKDLLISLISTLIGVIITIMVFLLYYCFVVKPKNKNKDTFHMLVHLEIDKYWFRIFYTTPEKIEQFKQQFGKDPTVEEIAHLDLQRVIRPEAGKRICYESANLVHLQDFIKGIYPDIKLPQLTYTSCNPRFRKNAYIEDLDIIKITVFGYERNRPNGFEQAFNKIKK